MSWRLPPYRPARPEEPHRRADGEWGVAVGRDHAINLEDIRVSF